MSTKKLTLLIYFLLAAAAITAFYRAIQCPFINFDDPGYVTDNIDVRGGITSESIRWAFTTGHAANWHPVTWLSHMLDVQLFGLNPRWHHLTNLLFHIANTLLLFFVFNRMTKAVWKSAFVAALFAVHPLHVESVAWVAERKDVLSTFFWMLTMVAYVRYVDHPGLKNYVPVIILFALGLMAKPMLVTLPFVLLLLDYWPLKRLEPHPAPLPVEGGYKADRPSSAKKKNRKSAKRSTAGGIAQSSVLHAVLRGTQSSAFYPLVREKIPLFALAALSCIVTYMVQKKGGALQSTAVEPGARIVNALVSYVIYIGKTIWPVNLGVLYPHPGWRPLWQALGAALVFMVVTFIAIRSAKKLPYLAFGWLWFAGTLVPVIGIVQVGTQAMADRYTYIPLIGLFVMAAWGIPELVKRWRYQEAALFALSVVVLICLSIGTWNQIGYWKGNISLWDHTLEAAGPSDIGFCNRGAAYEDLGNHEQALSNYDRAVEINPRRAEPHDGRGFVYQKLGKLEQAISEETIAIELWPEFAGSYGNRGTSNYKVGNYQQAISDFSRAVELEPGLAWAYSGRGKAYAKLGNNRQAISDYDKAIELNSQFTEAYNNRGVAYSMMGNNSQAISDYDKAIKTDPGYADAYYNRGVAYAMLGDYTLAISDYDRAVEINPEYADAYNNRGAVHGKLGNRRQAIEDLQKAARLGNEDAKSSLRSVGLSW